MRWALGAFGVLLVLAALAPILGSGMRGDDSHVSIDLEGHLAYHDQSLPAYLADQIEAGWRGGRFMPLGVSQGLTFDALLPERLPYKLGIVVACLLAIGMMWIFLRRLGLSSLPTLLIVAVAFTLSLQFRATHDPALGYSGTQQMTMVILFAALWSYLRYLQGERARWYVLALVLTVALGFTYEANPPLVLAFACLHLGQDPRRVRSWVTAIPFLGIGAAMTLLTVYTHSTTTAPAGYEAAIDVFTILQVALRQALSGFPGIYFASGSQGLLADPTPAELAGAFWRAGLLSILLLGAFLLVRRRPGRTAASRAGALPAAAVGVVLMACSGLFISLAAQHQQLIGLGGGHLATFAGTLGFVLLAVAAWTTWGASVARSPLAITLIVLFAGGLAFVSQYSNLRIVAIEKPGIVQRDLTRAAMKEGILDGVPASETIYVNSRDLGWSFGNLIFYPGTIDYLAYLQTGRQHDIRPDAPAAPVCPNTSGFPVQDCARTSRTVAVLAPRASMDGGVVIYADGIPRNRVADRPPKRIVALARGVSADGPIPPLVGARANGRPWRASDVTWTREDLDGGWVRYTANDVRSNGPVAWTLTDPRSNVNFNDATRTPGQTVRMFGTKYLLP